MTQAAVSYQIRVLEERLGLALFHRSKRRVFLTEAGRKAASMVTSAFDDLGRAFEAIAVEEGGVLSISTAATFASSWLAPRLGTFQIGQPDLAVRLSSENRLVDFSGEDVDAAIRIGKGGWPGLSHYFLFRSHVTPICSAEFAARHDLRRPEQLLDVPRISPDDAWWGLWFRNVGAGAHEPLQQRSIGFDSQLGEMRAVMAGHGVALMTPFFWQPEIASGRLVQPFETLLFPGTSYWLVCPEHKRGQPKIRAFREWLLAEIRSAARDVPEAVFTQPETAPSEESG